MEPTNKPEPMFVTWTNDKEKQAALAKASEGLLAAQPVFRTNALSIFRNIAPGNVSIQDDFTRRDYERFRPFERIPTRHREIIATAENYYNGTGIIKNVIDMMADFCSQGLDLVHRSEIIEGYFQQWMIATGLQERAERFCNYLFRHGNVIIKRRTGKMSAAKREEMRRSIALQSKAFGADQDGFTDETDVQLAGNEVPVDFIFLNPMTIDVVGEELAPFFGPEHYIFTLNLGKDLIRKLKIPKDGLMKDLITKLPVYIQNAINGKEDRVVLNREDIEVHYYKKDDWRVWANPLIYPIFKDIIMMEKMKLADLAALDGAISHIRIWKIGSLEHKIYPTRAAVARLSDMLLNNVGGGSMDLMWGPELELVETNTDIHKFLGSSKYDPVLTCIYQGLGIPPTLAGTQTGGGFTNNFISLRTLLERLKYGRDQLTAWLRKEVALFQKAMGFRFPAEVTFERMTLTDEAAEKALLLQLVDRDLISAETIQERFGEIPGIEKMRMQREAKQRELKRIQPKAGPYHVAHPENDLKKIALTTGQATPAELGLELLPNKDNQQTMLDQQADVAIKTAKMGPTSSTKPKGRPGQGRPKNSNDKTKRKKKEVKPKASANFNMLYTWFKQAQDIIANVINPVYLLTVGKKNMRGLTEEEFTNVETFKFALLASLSPHEDLNEEVIKSRLEAKLDIPPSVFDLYNQTVDGHLKKFNCEPTTEERRNYQVGALTFYHMEISDGEDNN